MAWGDDNRRDAVKTRNPKPEIETRNQKPEGNPNPQKKKSEIGPESFLVSGFWFLVSGFWFLASGFPHPLTRFIAASKAAVAAAGSVGASKVQTDTA